MESRLALCSTYLEDVESKIKEILALPGNDVETTAKLSEAISFVRQAWSAVTPNG
jgi:hypothetical protein